MARIPPAVPQRGTAGRHSKEVRSSHNYSVTEIKKMSRAREQLRWAENRFASPTQKPLANRAAVHASHFYKKSRNCSVAQKWRHYPQRIGMSISRNEALRRFDQRYRSSELRIHDVSESQPKDFYSADVNAWFIRFSIDPFPCVRPSRILCVSKSDGKILYDG